MPADDLGPADARQAGPRSKDTLTRKTGDLSEPEERLWIGSYSAKAMYADWLAAGAITAVLAVVLIIVGRNTELGVSKALLILLGLIVFIWGGLGLLLAYRRLSVGYELTNQRLIHHKGLLKRVIDRIELIDMDDVTVEQGIVERMLGVGKIRISSSDRTHPQLKLGGIDDVKRVADLIDDVRRTERRRRGVHIETI